MTNQRKKPSTSPQTREPRAYRWLREEKYGGEATAAFAEDCKRLDAGEPVEYVIGWSDVLGTRIALDSRPMIPRAETVHWIEQLIRRLEHTETRLSILDMFAGSGVVGITLLANLPHASVTFAERESAHLTQIARNLTDNAISPERWEIYEADVWEGVPHRHYDVICANPPYAGPDRPVQDSVLAWEPEASVFAPENGFFYIRRTLEEAPAYLARGGLLIIEFDPPQRSAIAEVAATLPYHHVTFWQDQYGEERVAVLTR